MTSSIKSREFIDFLSSIGIGREIELPQIAVMGDTSSGKSSLLSALSQIELPSSSELTTRCPTRLRMETRDVWSCKINILWHNKDISEESRIIKDPQEIASVISEFQKKILDQETHKTGQKVEISKSIVEVSNRLLVIHML